MWSDRRCGVNCDIQVLDPRPLAALSNGRIFGGTRVADGRPICNGSDSPVTRTTSAAGEGSIFVAHQDAEDHLLLGAVGPIRRHAALEELWARENPSRRRRFFDAVQITSDTTVVSGLGAWSFSLFFSNTSRTFSFNS